MLHYVYDATTERCAPALPPLRGVLRLFVRVLAQGRLPGCFLFVKKMDKNKMQAGLW
jgi:hypothetical protein